MLDGSHSGGCGVVVTDFVLDGGDGGGGGGVGAGVHRKTNPKDKNQTKIIFKKIGFLVLYIRAIKLFCGQ